MRGQVLPFTGAAGPGQAQSSLCPSPTELVTIFYYLKFKTSPTRKVRDRVAQLYTQALGSLIIVTCYSQGYGRGI
jgi:hypothetical protein